MVIKVSMPFRATWAWVKVFVAGVLGYEVLASAHLIDARMNICERCSQLDRRTDQCRACGCFIHAKTVMATESCPLNKWRSLWRRKSH